MSVLVQYPDPDVETTTVDGRVEDAGNTLSWASLIAEPGSGSVDNTASGDVCWWYATPTSNQWGTLERGFVLFNTASIGDTDAIDSTILSLYGNAKADPTSNTPSTNITACNPASNTALAAGDFDAVSSTELATAISYANYNIAGYNEYIFNASGIATVSKTGVSKYAIRNSADYTTTAPTWGSNAWTGFGGVWADTAGTASDPRLLVVYGAPTLDSFYPDPNVETTSVDGIVMSDGRTTGGFTTWAGIHDNTTIANDDGLGGVTPSLNEATSWTATAGGGVGAYYYAPNGRRIIGRGFFLFDTSALPNSATISSADFSWFTQGKVHQIDNTAYDYYNVVQTTPASNTDLVNGDFDKCGAISSPTKGASDIVYANVADGNYTSWTLNATGLGWISLTGVTKLGVREGHDIDNVEPTYGADGNKFSGTGARYADYAGTGFDPVLSLSYTDAGSGTILYQQSTVSSVVFIKNYKVAAY